VLQLDLKKVHDDETYLDQYIVLKALIDKNMPKLLFTDAQILHNIITDVFIDIPVAQLQGQPEVLDMINQRLDKRSMFKGADFA
jgi:hypothetical protein